MKASTFVQKSILKKFLFACPVCAGGWNRLVPASHPWHKTTQSVMNANTIVLGVFCGMALLPSALNAQVIYSDLGMASGAAYTVNASPLIMGQSIDYQANFG